MKQILYITTALLLLMSMSEASTVAGKSGEYRRVDKLYRKLLNAEQGYSDLKQTLANKGLTYSVDISFLAQRASPNGRGTPWQSQYYGTAGWDMFKSDTWGQGSAQIAYTAVRYWGAEAETINNRIGVVSSFNDYTTKADYFDQLSYTHQLAGDWNALSVTLGQFPMYNFDGGTYNSNQQINFLNDALSQNGSSTYSSAGVGGYMTLTPNSAFNVSLGFQDAHNISGHNISLNRLGKHKYTTFATLTYSPTVSGLGAGLYSFLYYNQPEVPEQVESNSGWSFNLQQQVSEKVVLFGRVNGVNRSTEGIKQSYVVGGVYNNPLNRNSLDQIGLALAVNRLNKKVTGKENRTIENVIETYWAWGVSDYMTLTPDIQFYINPGENRAHHTATVSSLRATLMF